MPSLVGSEMCIRDSDKSEKVTGFQEFDGKVLYFDAEGKQVLGRFVTVDNYTYYFDPKTGERYTNRSVLICLLYTSDAADDLLCVDLVGRRSIKKKKTNNTLRKPPHHK